MQLHVLASLSQASFTRESTGQFRFQARQKEERRQRSLPFFNLQLEIYNVRVMLSRELLDVLVCPACKKPLALTPRQDGLRCSECRRLYPIRDGIPVLLIDEASTDPS